MARRAPKWLRFTREGKVFVALTFAIGFAAVNTGNNLLHLILGMQLMLIIGSGVLSELTLARVRITRHLPRYIFAGEPLLGTFTVENKKRWLPSFSLEIAEAADVQGSSSDASLLLHAPAGKPRRVPYRHTFHHRGMISLHALRLSTRFPFGFFEKIRSLRAPEEVLVYPRTFAVNDPALRTRRGMEALAPRIGRRGEFHGLREYRSGDDPRDIAWRPSARLARPLVREYEDPQAKTLTLVLDNHTPHSSGANTEHCEKIVSVAASLILDQLREGASVALVTRDLRLAAGRGDRHLHRLLRELALLTFRDHGKASPLRGPANAIFLSATPADDQAA